MDSYSSDGDKQRSTRSVSPPPLSEFLSPRRFVGFLTAFIGSWFLSRNYQAFFAGTPALIFGFCAALAIWQLAKPPDVTLAAAYEKAAISAVRVDSYAESDLMWERLMQLRPQDQRYRFVLAKSLAERDEINKAVQHLDVLTGENGYPQARLWLVEQSREESPLFPLTSEQQIAQLQATIKEDPDNSETYRLLAQIYIERQDYRVAEQHLLRAAKSHPTLGLLLYELQTQLGRRDTEAALQHLQRAAAAFKQIVIDVPQDVQPRIFWAKALVYLGELAEAEAVLTEALKSYDSPELRTATAEFMVQRAQTLVAQSPLNARIAATYLMKAAQIQPGVSRLAPLCVVIGNMGAMFSAKDLAPIVSHQQTQLQKDPDNLRTRMVLGQLLAMQGDFESAIELLKPFQDDSPPVQTLLVKIFNASGQQDNAETVAATMLDALRAQVDAQPDQPEPVIMLTDGLINTQRQSEAIETIDAWTQRSKQELKDLPVPLKRLFVAASVSVFQKQTATSAVDESSFRLLVRATETQQVSGELLQLISSLAYSSGPFADQSNEILASVLSTGNASGRIYAALGTQALAGGDYDAAVGHLKAALAQTPHNPVIQNNLAVALVRQSTDNAAPAMELCNQALATMPQQPDVLSTRAEVHIARNRWPEARLDLETALPDRPNSLTLRRLLVRVYTEMNEPVLAAQHQKVLDELEAKQPTDTPSNG